MRRILIITKDILKGVIIALSLAMAFLFILSIFYTVDGYVKAYMGSSPDIIFKRIRVFPLYIGPVPILIPISILYSPTLSEFMVFLLFIYSICLFKTFFDGKKSIISVIRTFGDIRENSFISLTSYTNATLIIIILIQALQEKVGVETGHLTYKNELVKYLSVAMAPLIEEIGFRIFIIGILITCIYVGLMGLRNVRFSDILKTLIYPSYGEEKVIECTGINLLYKPAIIAIVISSIIFGLIHYLYGSGWEIGKITTATIAGLLLGYLYYKYGLPASIMSHYTFNHLLTTYYYLGEQSLQVLILDITILFQGIFLILYIMNKKILSIMVGENEV